MRYTAIIATTCIALLATFALAASDIEKSVKDKFNEVQDIHDGARYCPAPIVGKQCPPSSFAHYYTCCGNMMTDCCFAMQNWLMYTLIVLGVLIVIGCIGSLLSYFFCRLSSQSTAPPKMYSTPPSTNNPKKVYKNSFYTQMGQYKGANNPKMNGTIANHNFATPFTYSSYHLEQTVEIIQNRIFVGGLPQGSDEASLGAQFAGFGKITNCQIIRGGDGMTKGYGFVTFADVSVAKKIRELPADHPNFKYHGSQITIREARKRNHFKKCSNFVVPANMMVQNGGTHHPQGGNWVNNTSYPRIEEPTDNSIPSMDSGCHDSGLVQSQTEDSYMATPPLTPDGSCGQQFQYQPAYYQTYYAPIPQFYQCVQPPPGNYSNGNRNYNQAQQPYLQQWYPVPAQSYPHDPRQVYSNGPGHHQTNPSYEHHPSPTITYELSEGDNEA
uniref:RRM domain-containing protein n=1 Tax=Rhabditophanes sp. KR3021 TaxID=114890 RepID=A0AC35TIP0_9BILA